MRPVRHVGPDLFQSTLPIRGATLAVEKTVPRPRFQSTLPIRGATLRAEAARRRAGFQSTLPIRGATVRHRAVVDLCVISIHAPHTGSDQGHSVVEFTYTYFNPRSPYGERPCATWQARGTTNFNPRSPYGERRTYGIFYTSDERFQSTLPIRGATSCRSPVRKLSEFQSTLPIRGATRPVAQVLLGEGISIHAPHTGSDRAAPHTKPMANYFNPRSPYGERLGKEALSPWTLAFQSTLPIRGATARLVKGNDAYVISIHAPHTGSDIGHINALDAVIISIHAPHTGSDDAHGDVGIEDYISIHAPHTGSDNISNGKPSHKSFISIHAPHTGSDQGHSVVEFTYTYFNPRSPYGERPFDDARRASTARISIHAPHTGSDAGLCRRGPARGDFNPRSPYGERPSWPPVERSVRTFQSTLPIRGATRERLQHGLQGRISIHAPHTGSDRYKL